MLRGTVTGAGAIAAIGCALAGRARADELSLRAPEVLEPGLRAAVRVELGACLDADREAFQHAAQVELSNEPPAVGPVEVRIACDPAGLEAGVVLEVRRPDSARRYRYALDWHAQPLDARPRLLGLAVAEAVDASRIELTALPEPAPRAAAPGPRDAAPAPREDSAWNLAIVGSRRVFAGPAGVQLVGGGLRPSRRLSPHLRVAIDLLVEQDRAGVFVAQVAGVDNGHSGTIDVLSASAAPRLVLHAGGRLHGELGVAARAGVVRMQGETPASTGVVGNQLVRPWLGPAATAAVGFDLTPQVELGAGLELGATVVGTTPRALGEPAAVMEGRWLSLELVARVAL